MRVPAQRRRVRKQPFVQVVCRADVVRAGHRALDFVDCEHSVIIATSLFFVKRRRVLDFDDFGKQRA